MPKFNLHAPIPEKFFELNGAIYNRSNYVPLYNNKINNSDGEVDDSEIAVGLASISLSTTITIQRPVPLSEWIGPNDETYDDLSELLNDLSSVIGMSYTKLLNILADGPLTAPSYGEGSISGEPTQNIQVDSSGKLIETAPILFNSRVGSSSVSNQGFDITSNVTNFDVSSGSYTKIDIPFVSDEDSIHVINYPGETGITPAFNLPELNYLSIDETGTLITRNRLLTNSERRDEIAIGVISSIGGNIINVVSATDNYNSMAAQFYDLLYGLGTFKGEGLALCADNTDLSICFTGGSAFGPNINFSDPSNPHSVVVPASGLSKPFDIILGDGTIQDSGITQIQPMMYNPDGGSNYTSIGGGASRSSIMEVWYRPSSDKLLVLPGQSFYISLNRAYRDALAYNPVRPNILKAGTVKLGSIIVRSGATDLSEDTEAIYLQGSKFP